MLVVVVVAVCQNPKWYSNNYNKNMQLRLLNAGMGWDFQLDRIIRMND